MKHLISHSTITRNIKSNLQLALALINFLC